MKIALITSGNPDNMKGIMNFVQEKALRLKNLRNITIDTYLIRRRYSFIFSILKGKKRHKKEEKTNIGQVEYRNLWIKHGLFDYFLSYILHKKPFPGIKNLNSYVGVFYSYDIILTHNLDAHYLGLMVNRNFGIPFIATWHGSDINVTPKVNKESRLLIKKVIKTSNLNYFVSKKLLETSNKIINTSNKEYLYTGPSKYFYKYSIEMKTIFRKEYNIENKKVVGFVGNLVTIKNIKILPEIFYNLSLFNHNFVFWIVGDGAKYPELKDKLSKTGIDFRMFGKVEPNKMPEIMNCLDVLVLPSLNEGLPLVTLEAITCGSNVVGSNVGGISEAIGKENVFDLNDDFVKNITNRILEIIENEEKPKPLSKDFSWDGAIKKEVDNFNRILNELNSHKKSAKQV